MLAAGAVSLLAVSSKVRSIRILGFDGASPDAGEPGCVSARAPCAWIRKVTRRPQSPAGPPDWVPAVAGGGAPHLQPRPAAAVRLERITCR